MLQGQTPGALSVKLYITLSFLGRAYLLGLSLQSHILQGNAPGVLSVKLHIALVEGDFYGP